MRRAPFSWIIAATAFSFGANGVSAQAIFPSGPSATTGINNSAAYNSGFGTAQGSENRAADGSVRDDQGNLLIINGVMSGASTFSRQDNVHQYGAGFLPGAAATAIGNSLNVTVFGNWNTVIVDSEQVNHGDQNAEIDLNGELNL